MNFIHNTIDESDRYALLFDTDRINGVFDASPEQIITFVDAGTETVDFRTETTETGLNLVITVNQTKIFEGSANDLATTLQAASALDALRDFLSTPGKRLNNL